MLRAAAARTHGLHRALLRDSPSPIGRSFVWRPNNFSAFNDKTTNPQAAACSVLGRTTIQQQRRDYIFLPSSLSDAAKQLRSLLFERDADHRQRSSAQMHQRLAVKLQDRWQDTLSGVRERIKLLKAMQRKQRKLARQGARAARNSVANRSARYSLLVRDVRGRVGRSVERRLPVKYSNFVQSMRGKVGLLSSSHSVALNRGKRNLLSHYEAKKRVYARRRTARQTARRMGGSRTLVGVEAWRSNNGSSSAGTMAAAAATTWKGITLTEPVQRSWFDDEGYPLTSRDPETGRFVNPWMSESTDGDTGLRKFLRWKLGGPWRRFLEATGVGGGSSEESKGGSERKSSDAARDDARGVVSAEGETGEASVPASPDARTTRGEAIDLTWIGHSSALVTFPGDFAVLTDPHFSNYAGPVRRTAPPAFGVADCPDVVDCVLISHDHMDHLDYWSILELIESNKVKIWVVPLGIKSWLMDKAGVSPEDIVELEWWEGVRISKEPKCEDSSETALPEVAGLVRAYKDGGRNELRPERKSSDRKPRRNELTVTCAPAQHWCSRTPLDRNWRLWCSFAVRATPALSSKTHSFYFAGDTGLPPEFPLHRQIGDRLGPFDLSAIPIGAYEPGWFMRESHCDPKEAVRIHQAVRSRKSVAIHFDTFDLADEPREEPPRLLLDEVDATNKKIGEMAAEVAAVADEAGFSSGVGMSKCDELDIVESGKETSFSSSSHLSQANGELIEMLPPFVDFSVISQGQSIRSLPK